MPQPELVIFDCDGTLVDSEIIASQVDTALLAEQGVEISVEEFNLRYAGLTFADAVLRVERDFNVPLQAFIIDRSKDILDRRLATEVMPVAGAAAAVRTVTAPKCVCSNSAPARLNAMLKCAGLLALFGENVYSARTLPSPKPKPAPDIFLFAADKMNAKAESCFVIEDSVHGIAAAKAARMRVIGFTGGAHSWLGHAEALSEAGAETVIHRWADFPPVLAALSEWSEAD